MDLTSVVQALLVLGTCESLDGCCGNVNSFHEAGPVDQAVQAGFEEWLQHALELNGGGVKIELADFLGKLHAGLFRLGS